MTQKIPKKSDSPRNESSLSRSSEKWVLNGKSPAGYIEKVPIFLSYIRGSLGRTEDAKRSGSPKKTHKKQEPKIEKYLRNKAHGSLTSVQHKLEIEDLSLSLDTTRNIVICQQLVYRIKMSKPELTD
jgi:hypothetical protein